MNLTHTDQQAKDPFSDGAMVAYLLVSQVISCSIPSQGVNSPFCRFALSFCFRSVRDALDANALALRSSDLSYLNLDGFWRRTRAFPLPLVAAYRIFSFICVQL